MGGGVECGVDKLLWGMGDIVTKGDKDHFDDLQSRTEPNWV